MSKEDEIIHYEGYANFILYGLYQVIGTNVKGKIKVDVVNVNPQTVFGSNIDGQPKIHIKGNKVTVQWTINEVKK